MEPLLEISLTQDPLFSLQCQRHKIAEEGCSLCASVEGEPVAIALGSSGVIGQTTSYLSLMGALSLMGQSPASREPLF